MMAALTIGPNGMPSMDSQAWALTIFWVAATGLSYAYPGYAAVMAGLAWMRRRGFQRDGQSRRGAPRSPSVTVVLVIHNEAHRIANRVANLLEAGLPLIPGEILVVLDGCTDGTLARLEGIGQPRVRWVEVSERHGKASGLNRALAACRGEVVVFADARQRFAPDTLRRLVEAFRDPRVGAVSGALEIESAASGTGRGVDAYWRLEKFIRASEARWDSSIGCTGAVYAIRRELFEPLPPDTILDDVVIPMRIALKGYRVLFDPEAKAYDPQTLEPEREKIRKTRTLAGNFEMLFRYPGWLLPWRNRLWWQLISHKYLRLAAPIFLLLAFLSNLALVSRPFYAVCLAAQVSFYLMALVGIWVRRAPFSIAAGFVFLNWTVVRALWAYLRGTHRQGWQGVAAGSAERGAGSGELGAGSWEQGAPSGGRTELPRRVEGQHE